MILSSGTLSILDLDRSAFDPSAYDDDAEVAVYDLRATIAEVKIKKGPGHLVAHINVSEDLIAPKWYFFNDFSVVPLENEERIFQIWKVHFLVLFLVTQHLTVCSTNCRDIFIILPITC